MLEPFFNPDELNTALPRPFRIASVVLLAAGAAIAFVIAFQTIRDWRSSPHPAGFLIFVGSIALLTMWIAAPVAAPPRPSIVRVLGLLLFVFCGLAALVSDTFTQRELIGGLAVGGLGWFLWPRRSRHAA